MPYINGQFVEKNQLGQQAPGTNTGITSPTGITGSGLGDTSSLQKLLGMYALSKDNPTGAWSILSANTVPEDERKVANAKKLIKGNIEQLERLYFGKKLYKGAIGGIFSEIGRKTNPGSDYDIYRNLIESMRPGFVKAAGDTGQLSETEQKAAVKNLPSARFTRIEARKAFNEARIKNGLDPVDAEQDNIFNFAKQYE